MNGDRGAPPESHRGVLLTVQYDGTDFRGWQVQPGQRTVQSTLTEAVERMVRHPITPRGTSRTDSGVHARALPVAFDTWRPISADGFTRGLNSLLPSDCAVIDARDVPLGYRPRDAAVAKTYTYRYQVGPVRRPLRARTSWFLRRRAFDHAAFAEACGELLGEHDFTSFRAADCDARSPIRFIHRVEASPEDEDRIVALTITGNAFLRNMVRIIAGTLAEVALGQRSPASVGDALRARDRRAAGPTAPPGGLTLTAVHFEGYPRLGKPDYSPFESAIADAPSGGDPGHPIAQPVNHPEDG